MNDADTGLTYMQQRYYDPVAARFLSEDPLLTDANTGASFNRYAYALNNPYKYIDPDGRDNNIVVSIGGSLVVGGGVEGSVGVYFSGYPNLDAGVTASGGYGAGALVGLGAAVAIIPGSVENIGGTTTNTNVATPIISGTLIKDPVTGKTIGRQGSLGAKLGGSITTSKTSTYGIRDLIKAIANKISSKDEKKGEPKPEEKPKVEEKPKPIPKEPEPLRF
ncbi:RHS repeat-associated core domain-containing protein [Undibacterium sp.]|uniref:RHS repeat-associated core domain-containing protein n=1 Tax=Undibacterium sp. TaxID=1914977 RepID=UPI00272A3FC1|nr:RHS repeat-associated core domain-containing protein [Undibacterium sp.]